MHITIRCIYVAVLVVSAHADCYNEGSQRFCEPTLTVPHAVQNYEPKDVILYLTPRQVQALEARGVLLRPEKNEHEQQYPVENEQEQEQEEEEFEQSTKREETENTAEQNRKDMSELENIFSFLNTNIVEDAKKILGDNGEVISQTEEGQEKEEADIEYHERVKQPVQLLREQQQRRDEEKDVENFRRIPARFGVLHRYITPSIIKKEKQPRKHNFSQLLNNDQKFERLQEEFNEESETEIIEDTKERVTSQTLPNIIISIDGPEQQSPEENKQNVDLSQDQSSLTRIPKNDFLAQSIIQLRDKLIQNEIQLHTGLQELKQAPKYNNQEYAIEIEKLRANLEQQNALVRAEFLARTVPYLSKKQMNGKFIQVEDDNRESLSAQQNSFAGSGLRSSSKYAPFQVITPIPVPVIKRSRIELKTSVPVETDNQSTVTAPKKVYVTLDKPYLERIDPIEINKQLISIRKPEDLRIIRHLWEH